MNIFDKHTSLLERGLDLRIKRNEYTAANIANRETPGYLAKDVVFDKALNEALNSDQPGRLNVSHPKHFSGKKEVSIDSVRGEIINSFNPDPKKDGNTVNLEKELAKLAENQVMYNSLVKMTSHKMKLLKDAIIEGGR